MIAFTVLETSRGLNYKSLYSTHRNNWLPNDFSSFVVAENSLVTFTAATPRIMKIARGRTPVGILTWIGMYAYRQPSPGSRDGLYYGFGLSLLDGTIEGRKAQEILSLGLDRLSEEGARSQGAFEIGQVCAQDVGLTQEILDEYAESIRRINPNKGLGCESDGKSCYFDLSFNSNGGRFTDGINLVETGLAFRDFSRALLFADSIFNNNGRVGGIATLTLDSVRQREEDAKRFDVAQDQESPYREEKGGIDEVKPGTTKGYQGNDIATPRPQSETTTDIGRVLTPGPIIDNNISIRSQPKHHPLASHPDIVQFQIDVYRQELSDALSWVRTTVSRLDSTVADTIKVFNEKIKNLEQYFSAYRESTKSTKPSGAPAAGTDTDRRLRRFGDMLYIIVFLQLALMLMLFLTLVTVGKVGNRIDAASPDSTSSRIEVPAAIVRANQRTINNQGDACLTFSAPPATLNPSVPNVEQQIRTLRSIEVVANDGLALETSKSASPPTSAQRIAAMRAAIKKISDMTQADIEQMGKFLH